VKSLTQKTSILSCDEIMCGFSHVAQLYPHIPSMTIWRSCEYAAYKRYRLPEPILDVGCGDGQYFRLVWPEIKNVVGVDIDVSALGAAAESGVYSAVHNVPAVSMPFDPNSFASAFANCSLEHMDNIEVVLKNVWKVLQPGGKFLLSVTTEKFLEWTTLPQLMNLLKLPLIEEHLLEKYKTYHHLVSAFTPKDWANKLGEAGFEILEHIPIVPEILGRFNMFSDMLWHVPDARGGEFGSVLELYLRGLNNFPDELGNIVRSLLLMEKSPHIGAGAVFMVRKA